MRALTSTESSTETPKHLTVTIAALGSVADASIQQSVGA
jgi:hypothetical protein